MAPPYGEAPPPYGVAMKSSQGERQETASSKQLSARSTNHNQLSSAIDSK